ncbi:hypothetical protein V2E24_00605 [Mycoplasmopsis ciconiae]|uniref:Carbohydrate kinase PfkB domain-containing protein n=1 Tax=Mycoplasmopsis ciconiae TaxID=561067 RepID=A0ABU7MKM8_9BACT|nr:hypothetical protein [Mycoplasmopsis ciconiae]
MNSNNNSKKVLVIGEALVNFDSDKYLFNETNNFNVKIAGSSTIVAANIGRLTKDVRILTILDQNNLFYSKIIDFFSLNHVQSYTVNYEGRVGALYTNNSQDKNKSRFYDISNTSFSASEGLSFELRKLIDESISHIYISMIDIYRNRNLKNTWLTLLRYAKNQGLSVSINLNYSPDIFKNFSEFTRLCQEFLEYCDYVYGYIDLVFEKDNTEIEVDRYSFKRKAEVFLQTYKNVKALHCLQITQNSTNKFINAFSYFNSDVTESPKIKIDNYDHYLEEAFIGAHLSAYNSERPLVEALHFALKATYFKSLYYANNNLSYFYEIENYIIKTK